MPFTFSHPAIILPFQFFPKKYFSQTGLIIGSLTPDFEYFLRMEIKSIYSHSLGGLFWFDLPLGIVMAYLFHTLIRDTLFDHLPHFLKSRSIAYRNFDWVSFFGKNRYVIIVSVLIGAASHIFWDSFTHHNGYFVNMIPALNQTVKIFEYQTPIFKILQHASSFFGGTCIVIAILKMPLHSIENNFQSLKYWGVWVCICLGTIILKLFNSNEIIQIGNLIVTIISAALLSILCTSILFKIKVD